MTGLGALVPTQVISLHKRQTLQEGAGKSRAADMEQGVHKIKFVASRLS